MPVLVLNASYEPVNITRARRALVLLIKGVAVIEEAHDRYVHVVLQLPCVMPSPVSACAVADPDAFEEEHPHSRRVHLPVLRREILEPRIGTRARDSARSRWTEHMGEHCCCMSRLQCTKGRSDTGGSEYETAPPAAPRDDSHLSNFHAPDRSRRGEVEEVFVLLKFSRHSSRSERRLGIAKDVG